jgi:hypothetical protein
LIAKDKLGSSAATDLDLIMVCFAACLKPVISMFTRREVKGHALVRGFSVENKVLAPREPLTPHNPGGKS